MSKSDLTNSEERGRILEDNARRLGEAIVQIQRSARQMETNGRTGDVEIGLHFVNGHAKYVRVRGNRTIV